MSPSADTARIVSAVTSIGSDGERTTRFHVSDDSRSRAFLTPGSAWSKPAGPLSSTSQNWTRLQTSVGQHQMFEHDEGVGTRRDIATRYYQEGSLRSPQDLDTQTRRANETRLPNPPSQYQTRAGRAHRPPDSARASRRFHRLPSPGLRHSLWRGSGHRDTSRLVD